MNILFVHQNFPGQFRHLAPALAGVGHNVTALTLRQQPTALWKGVRIVNYAVRRGSAGGIHPWVTDFEAKIIRAEACFRAALDLKRQGFAPDVIIAHPGWGESLFLKDVWPKARMGLYCEFFYLHDGADVGFDPEFPNADPGSVCRLRLKNLNSLLHFETADGGMAPTKWQAGTFPEQFRDRIAVIHDGIDTEMLAPNFNAVLTLSMAQGYQVRLTRDDEIVTFVNRNLEPYRGYHVFMRALPELLRKRPRVRVVIVGGDKVSYGAPPDPAGHGAATWKEVYIREVRGQIPDADWSRVHFVGHVPYAHFVTLLQLSTVHVYLTYPFVLSWSLLEAMSTGCAIVASDTPPVREAISHDETGLLTDFFDVQGLAGAVLGLLDDVGCRKRFGFNARAFAAAHYDLHKICLPQQLDWVFSLRSGRVGDAPFVRRIL